MEQLQIIVVSKGLLGLLRTCVEMAAHSARTCAVETNITVVDNSSEHPYCETDFVDDSLDLIRFDTPQGFAASCNAAAKCSKSTFILLLNNDVLLLPQTLRGMLDSLTEERIGICGAGLLFPDGTIQHAGVVFGAGESGPYHQSRGKIPEQCAMSMRAFQAVTGACMLIRRSVFERLGGLDESYPFGLEDIDFCLRAGQHGVRTVCFTGEYSLHFESMTEGRIELDVPSREIFMRRWGGKHSVDGDLAAL